MIDAIILELLRYYYVAPVSTTIFLVMVVVAVSVTLVDLAFAAAARM